MERPANLPDWEELVRLPDDDVRRILEPLVTQYDDVVLGEWFGVSDQRVGYLRRKVGLERARGRGSGIRKTEGGSQPVAKAASAPEISMGLPQGTLELSLSGRFTREELFRKLEKLRAVVDLLDAKTFSASIQISEVATVAEEAEDETEETGV